MAATKWHPRYNNLSSTRKFLLVDGTVVGEPALEESGSGVKYRLAAHPKITAFRKDKDDLIKRGLSLVKPGAQFWMRLDEGDTRLHTRAGFKPNETKATFEAGEAQDTTVWWLFKHKTMPIKAILSVTINRTRYGGESHSVVTTLTYPNTKPDRDLSFDFNNYADPSFAVSGTDWGNSVEWAEFVRDSPSEWSEMLGKVEDLTERRAVEHLLRQVRKGEALDAIEIPDLRGEEPDWLELELADTNVTGRFLSDLREYLEGSSGVERAVEIYGELISCLRSIGMVMDTPLSGNDFMQALLRGDKEPLTISLGAALADDDKLDTKHKVSAHLPTGTFVVTCEHSIDRDEMALSWDEAVLRAELTGTKDRLLAYADAFVADQHDRRTKSTIDRRKSALGNN